MDVILHMDAFGEIWLVLLGDPLDLLGFVGTLVDSHFQVSPREMLRCLVELNQGSDWDKYVAWTRQTWFLQSECPLGSFYHILLQEN